MGRAVGAGIRVMWRGVGWTGRCFLPTAFPAHRASLQNSPTLAPCSLVAFANAGGDGCMSGFRLSTSSHSRFEVGQSAGRRFTPPVSRWRKTANLFETLPQLAEI